MQFIKIILLRKISGSGHICVGSCRRWNICRRWNNRSFWLVCGLKLTVNNRHVIHMIYHTSCVGLLLHYMITTTRNQTNRSNSVDTSQVIWDRFLQPRWDRSVLSLVGFEQTIVLMQFCWGQDCPKLAWADLIENVSVRPSSIDNFRTGHFRIGLEKFKSNSVRSKNRTSIQDRFMKVKHDGFGAGRIRDRPVKSVWHRSFSNSTRTVSPCTKFGHVG